MKHTQIRAFSDPYFPVYGIETVVPVFYRISYARKNRSEKAHISAYFTSCQLQNMFKVINKDTRIRKVNDKVNNKDILDVVLVSLLLTLNTFHFLLAFLLLTLTSYLPGEVIASCSDVLCLLESIWAKFQLMEKLGK